MLFLRSQEHVFFNRRLKKTNIAKPPYPIRYSNLVLVTQYIFFFSPAGWDSEKKIAILCENMHSIRPDQYYTDVIAKPIVRKSTNNRDVEVTAEDEQQFLVRQQQYLQVRLVYIRNQLSHQKFSKKDSWTQT